MCRNPPSLLITGLKHPKVAAGIGAAWFVGRVLYTIGYATGNPGNRNTYSLALPSLTALGMSSSRCLGHYLVGSHYAGALLSTGYTVFQFIKEGL